MELISQRRDTWKPKIFGGSPSEVAAINHGTYFYHAAMEGLLKNDTNIHAAIRTTISGPSDYENDGYCGFEIVEAREIDSIGTEGIIQKIRRRVGTENPVYLSIDIDTLDPACEYCFLCILLGYGTCFCVESVTYESHENSCAGHWHPRNRRLVHTRATDDHTRPGGSQFHRCGYRRGGASI